MALSTPFKLLCSVSNKDLGKKHKNIDAISGSDVTYIYKPGSSRYNNSIDDIASKVTIKGIARP